MERNKFRFITHIQSKKRQLAEYHNVEMFAQNLVEVGLCLVGQKVFCKLTFFALNMSHESKKINIEGSYLKKPKKR
jgi:hypothetical protein